MNDTFSSGPAVSAPWLLENLVVCMLFFNKLEQTIESSSSFVASGVRVNLLNNGSEPEALEALKAYYADNPRVTILDAGGNRGVSGGRNLQITGTTEPWLLFVDNDITVDTASWLERLAHAMNNCPQAEIFVPRLFNKHEDAWGWLSDFVVDGYGNCAFVRTDAPFANSFPGGASIISRKVFERAGVYDEDLFVGFEDFEMAIRAWRQGRPLLVRSVEDVTLIHDHRVSTVAADKSAALVRYNVGHIRRSHSVILDKHGILLDPNFADWLQEQVHQLTGENALDMDDPATECGGHALHGLTVAPHYCAEGRVVVIVDGSGSNLWMRLRALGIARGKARAAKLDVRVQLVGAPRSVAAEAQSLELVDDALTFEEWRLAASAHLAVTDIYCWIGCALVTSDFLVQAAQSSRFDPRAARAMLHPGRVLRASTTGEGEQLVRVGEFDPLDFEHSAASFPVFAMPGFLWDELISSGLLSWAPDLPEAMACWMDRSAQYGVGHVGLAGSAAIVEVLG